MFTMIPESQIMAQAMAALGPTLVIVRRREIKPSPAVFQNHGSDA
jgi:hypothetical protein